MNTFLQFFIPTLAIACALLVPVFVIFMYKPLLIILDIIRKNKAAANKEAIRELEDKISKFGKGKWRLFKTSQPPNNKMITLHLTNEVVEIEFSMDKSKY